MFRKKPKKCVVKFTPNEVQLLLTALLRFRNKAIRAGKPIEDINELILMITK